MLVLSSSSCAVARAEQQKDSMAGPDTASKNTLLLDAAALSQSMHIRMYVSVIAAIAHSESQ